MREVRWQIEEQFCFPPKLGVIKKVKSFTVQPKWQMRTFNQSVQLLGIYHMKANVLFRDGKAEPLGILIEDFDFNEDHAYFEYAFPLKIDLPNGEYKDITIKVLNERTIISPTNNLIVSFEVVCKFKTNNKMVEAEQNTTLVASNDQLETEGILVKTSAVPSEAPSEQLHQSEENTASLAEKDEPSTQVASAKTIEQDKEVTHTINEENTKTASIQESVATSPQESAVTPSQESSTPSKKATAENIEQTKEEIIPTSVTVHKSTEKPTPSPSKPKTSQVTKENNDELATTSAQTDYEYYNSELDFLANLQEEYSELVVQSNKVRP